MQALNTLSSMLGGTNKSDEKSKTPPKHISSLPPDMLVRVFSFLPVTSIPVVSRVSRRWKVLVYSDAIYDPKLNLLHMSAPLLLPSAGTGTVSEAGLEAKDRLVARLRQLPGGQFLPTNGKFLNLEEKSPTVASTLTESPSTNTTATTQITQNTATESPLDITAGGKTISAALPDSKAAHLIIGSGGLKAALTKAAAAQNEKGNGKKSALQRLKDSEKKDEVNERRNLSRDAFRKVFVELYPYYIDFAERSNDSLVFRDYSDLSEIAAVLSRLLLFDAALFLDRDTKNISSNLHSTVQWFESRLLGQFDFAYDKHDINEMRVNAYAAFQLNGGMGCVQVFVSKNPVFFDLTFNPSLLDSKLPALSGPSMGYAMADEFAKYMDYMLSNCNTQAELVSQVFVPSVNAMTIFMEKVFEDSIAEYLNALVTSAKAREGLVIYLHTLASSIYSCSQLVKLLAHNPYGVHLDEESLKKRVADLFAPYMVTYPDLELEHLRKRFKTEIDKWDKRGQKGKPLTEDSKKNMSMMGSMKAMVMAPVALLGGGMKRGQSQPLLTDVDEENIVAEAKDTATYSIADQSMNSLVSLELALHLMHTNKESLGRALVSTANTDMTKLRQAVQKIFVLLLKVLGEKHLKPAFAIAIERLSKSAPIDFGEGNKMVNMDSLQFFDLIQMGDLVQKMIQAYYQEDIRMWIDEQDFLSDIIIEKKAFERLLDDSVAAGMDKAIQVLINQCEFLLISGHNLNDFNPGANELVMDVKPTKACQQVMACLEVHTKALKGSIEANTMEVFLGEVSIRLFQVIIKNIRRLQVSQTGAMQLICDFNRYYDWAYSLRLTAATKMFQALKELGNLFLADGSEELRSLVHDVPRFNGALRIEEIYELLQSRADYKEIRTQVEAKECCIQ